MKYYIYRDRLHRKLAWFSGFVDDEIEVSKGQYYFLTICGFLGYKKRIC